MTFKLPNLSELLRWSFDQNSRARENARASPDEDLHFPVQDDHFATNQISEHMLMIGRLGIWMTFLMAPVVMGFSLFLLEEYGRALVPVQFFFYAIPLFVAVIIAHSGKMRALVHANMIVFTALTLTWVVSIEVNPGYVSTKNYFVFLPLSTLVFMQAVVVFALDPRMITIFGSLHFVIVFFYPFFRDQYAFPHQVEASFVFLISYVMLLTFSGNVHTLFSLVNQSLVSSQREKKEAERARNILSVALEGTPVGLLAYNSNGKQILQRNVASVFEVDHDFENMKDFENFLIEMFDLDVNHLSVKPVEINYHDRHYVITKKQLSSMSVYAVIDITESREWEERVRSTQKLGLIGQITSGIAHDYNNILAIAMSNLEAFPREREDVLWKEYLAPVLLSLEHARTVSHKLLSFSGAKELQLCVIDLQKTLSEMEPIFQYAVGPKISLILDIPEGSFVRSDVRELEAALLNIVLNASNAIGDRAGQVKIRAYQDEENAVSIEITDTGPGISEEHIERIFEPFFTTRKSQYSTGLGLSIVKSFAEQSGGSVRVQSRLGKTTFTLSLPKGMPSPVKKVETTAEISYVPAAGAVQKLLLVDDNNHVLQALHRVIELAGVECISSMAPSDALDIVREVPDIDVAFIDLSMPEMDGITLGKQLMRIVPHIGYFILTGEASEETRRRAKKVGFVDVIYKPVRATELLRIANRYLDRKENIPQAGAMGA